MHIPERFINYFNMGGVGFYELISIFPSLPNQCTTDFMVSNDTMSRWGWLAFCLSLLVLQDQSQDVCWAVLLTGGSWGKFISDCWQDISLLQLQEWGPCFPAGCQLRAELWLLEPAHISSHAFQLDFSSSNQSSSSPSHFLNLSAFPFCHISLTNSSGFSLGLRDHDCIRPTQLTQNNLLILRSTES